MLTRIVAVPSEYADCPAKRSHGRSVPPMPKPVVVPEISIRSPERAPVMTTDGRGAATGVTVLDGAEDTDQPAPVSAFTVKVYAVPFVRPVTSQESAGAVTKHEPPAGDDVTW
jgi:hypothetical protein